MKKLLVGGKTHTRESEHDKRRCSCWTNCKTDDHLLQCPKQKQHRSEIFQTIDRLGNQIDPILHNILRDRLEKNLGRYEQSAYDKESPTNGERYLQLQKNKQKLDGTI